MKPTFASLFLALFGLVTVTASAAAQLPSDELVRRILGRQRPALDACIADSTGPLRLEAVLYVGGDGAVRTATVGGDMGDRRMESCVRAALLRLQFPEGSGAFRAHLTLVRRGSHLVLRTAPPVPGARTS